MYILVYIYLSTEQPKVDYFIPLFGSIGIVITSTHTQTGIHTNDDGNDNKTSVEKSSSTLDEEKYNTFEIAPINKNYSSCQSLLDSAISFASQKEEKKA